MTLDACRKDFEALIKRIVLQKAYENSDAKSRYVPACGCYCSTHQHSLHLNRPSGLAWEVRKTTSPGKPRSQPPHEDPVAERQSPRPSPARSLEFGGGKASRQSPGPTWADRVRGVRRVQPVACTKEQQNEKNRLEESCEKRVKLKENTTSDLQEEGIGCEDTHDRVRMEGEDTQDRVRMEGEDTQDRVRMEGEDTQDRVRREGEDTQEKEDEVREKGWEKVTRGRRGRVFSSGKERSNSVVDSVSSCTRVTLPQHQPTCSAAKPVSQTSVSSSTVPATHGSPLPEAVPATHGRPLPEAVPATHGSPLSEAVPATHGSPLSEAVPATPGSPLPEAVPATPGSPLPEADCPLEIPASVAQVPLGSANDNNSQTETHMYDPTNDIITASDQPEVCACAVVLCACLLMYTVAFPQHESTPPRTWNEIIAEYDGMQYYHIPGNDNGLILPAFLLQLTRATGSLCPGPTAVSPPLTCYPSCHARQAGPYRCTRSCPHLQGKGIDRILK